MICRHESPEPNGRDSLPETLTAKVRREDNRVTHNEDRIKEYIQFSLYRQLYHRKGSTVNQHKYQFLSYNLVEQRLQGSFPVPPSSEATLSYSLAMW